MKGRIRPIMRVGTLVLGLIAGAGALWARVSCLEFHEPGGGCETICDFYDNETGRWQGSVTYGWCD